MTPLVVLPATPADGLRRAAEVIELRGWYRGWYCQGERGEGAACDYAAGAQGPVDLLGAIRVGYFGNPMPADTRESLDALKPAERLLEAAIEAQVGRPMQIDTWNDSVCTTGWQATAMLRLAAGLGDLDRAVAAA